jgi:glycine cleavage system regulatory protein
MMKPLVLTLIGADRPGLVEALSQAIADHGGSWEHSHMARLAGHFAGILQLSIPLDRAEELGRALSALETEGLKVTVEDGAAELKPSPITDLELELVGQDRPGIVREIATAIASLGVNVVSLESHCSPAPMSGETLFTARAHLQAPTDLDVDALRESLEKIADDLMADIQFETQTSG